MAAPAKIDWFKAREDYLSDSTLSYSDIAKKYDVSLTAVKTRGNNEDWLKLRQSLTEKALSKFQERLVDEKSKANSKHLTHWQNIQALANGLIIDMANRSYYRNKDGNLILDRNNNPILVPIDPFALERLVRALKEAINGERVVLGLPTSVSGISAQSEDNNVWSSFSDLIKAADKVLAEHDDS